MNSIQVRQAVFADLEALSSLLDQYRILQGKPTDIKAAIAFLKARFDHGESVAFLAEQQNAPIGFAHLYPIYSSVSLARVYILNDLYVTQAGRRKGVASSLLAEVEEYARLNQAARISLNVAQDNLEGQALYNARGWCKDSEFYMYHCYPSSA